MINLIREFLFFMLGTTVSKVISGCAYYKEVRLFRWVRIKVQNQVGYYDRDWRYRKFETVKITKYLSLKDNEAIEALQNYFKALSNITY
jgi:hypothetical protein